MTDKGERCVSLEDRAQTVTDVISESLGLNDDDERTVYACVEAGLRADRRAPKQPSGGRCLAKLGSFQCTLPRYHDENHSLTEPDAEPSKDRIDAAIAKAVEEERERWLRAIGAYADLHVDVDATEIIAHTYWFTGHD